MAFPDFPRASSGAAVRRLIDAKVGGTIPDGLQVGDFLAEAHRRGMDASAPGTTPAFKWRRRRSSVDMFHR
jgi:hypothetical protein